MALQPANNPVVQEGANTAEGRRLLAEAGGETTSAALAVARPVQPAYRGDPAEIAPLDPGSAVVPAFGASGTVIFAGFISQEEYNNKLVGRQGLMKFDEMRKSDATVRWSLQVVKLPLRAAEWRIQEASDSERDKAIAKFVQYNLFERLSWKSILREICTYLEFGFFVGEKSYIAEIVDGKPMIVLHKLDNRKQTTVWRWEQSDGTAGITQVTAQGTFNIPENRLFILTHEREGNNYYGVSLLRSSYKHWYMKDAMYKISAVAAERQGVGVLKIKAVSKPQESEKQAAIESAENLRASNKGYVVEPENFTMEFMDMFARANMDLGADIEHHDRQIMKNVGAAFMEMGATRSSGSTGGSKSASNDQSRVFEWAVEAVAEEIQEAINTMVIRQLVDLNFTGVTHYPTLEHNKIGETDIVAYATAIASLMNVDAITPDPDLEQSLRDRTDLPDLPDDIRKNYKERDRSQAATVPQYAPGTAPGQKSVPINQGAKPAPRVTAPAKTGPKKPATMRAGELAIDGVRKFYAELGDQIDAIEHEG